MDSKANEPTAAEATDDESTAALLALLKEGDDQALNHLIGRYYPRVLRMVKVRLGPFLAGRVDFDDIAHGQISQRQDLLRMVCGGHLTVD